MTEIPILEFKGGSLGHTKLFQKTNGNKFVRKSINSQIEREYGLVRWLSQYKRLQSYNELFPNIFPKVLNLGSYADYYYMDLEFFDGYVNVSDFLVSESDKSKIYVLVEKILDLIEQMYSCARFISPHNALQIYNQEEVIRKLEDAKFSEDFNQFTKYPVIRINGVDTKALETNIELVTSKLAEISIPFESVTHGNLTLENIMVNPDTMDVKFIDPYEENVVDVLESDFSQILQSCQSNYEVLNTSSFSVEHNCISYIENFALGTKVFEKYFKERFNRRFSVNKFLSDYFHFSQFVRMLPFKVKSNYPEKAILFYALACKLLTEMNDEQL